MSPQSILRRLALLSIPLLFLCGELRADNAATKSLFADSVSVFFRQSSATVDPAFSGNASRLDSIIALLGEAVGSDSLELVGVTFTGSASPEGGAALNRRLAERRMAALEDYVRSRVVIPDSVITRRSSGANWQLLADMVLRSDMDEKEEILQIIDSTPELTFDSRGRAVGSLRKTLMDLHGGRTWRKMFDRFFAGCRNASVVSATVRGIATEPEPEPEPEEEVADTVAAAPVAAVAVAPDTVPADTVAAPAARRRRPPFYMSLQTNMLYDVLAVPNIAAEFYVGANLSIAGHWMYAWWSHSAAHRYWRIYGGDIALRWWFGGAARRKPLTGHHIGIYGQGLIYDFEFSGKGQMGGRPGGSIWDKLNYAGGIEYGYSLPIARRLNIDFTIGLGYLGGTYYEYTPMDGHYVWQATKKRNWWGPTKAEISLVWLLGSTNVNARKGGAR